MYVRTAGLPMIAMRARRRLTRLKSLIKRRRVAELNNQAAVFAFEVFADDGVPDG